LREWQRKTEVKNLPKGTPRVLEKVIGEGEGGYSWVPLGIGEQMTQHVPGVENDRARKGGCRPTLCAEHSQTGEK